MITWEPEFTVCRMTDADATLILGCDGVWKTIDAQRAVEIVQKAMESGDSPAQRLVKHAVEEGAGPAAAIEVVKCVCVCVRRTEF